MLKTVPETIPGPAGVLPGIPAQQGEQVGPPTAPATNTDTSTVNVELATLGLEIDLELAAWRNPGPRFFTESTTILNAWNRREAEQAASVTSTMPFTVSLGMQQEWIDKERQRAQAALASEHNKAWGEEYMQILDARQAALDEHVDSLIGKPYEPTYYPTQPVAAPRPSRRKAARLGLPPINLSYQLAEPVVREMGYPDLRALINEKKHVLNVRHHVNQYLQQHPDATEAEIDEIILAFDTALREQANNESPFEHVGIDMQLDPSWRPNPARWLQKVGRPQRNEQQTAQNAKRNTGNIPLGLVVWAQTRRNESRPGLKTAVMAGVALALGASAVAFIDTVGDFLNNIGNQATHALKQRLKP